MQSKILFKLLITILIFNFFVGNSYSTEVVYHGEHGCCVEQTIDNGYIIGVFDLDVGSSNYSETNSIGLLKTTSDGKVEWYRIFPCSYLGYYEYGVDVHQTSDDGFILLSSALIKTDSYGNELWNKTVSGDTVQQTTDDGYIIAGKEEAGYYKENLFLIKTNSSGDIEWNVTFNDFQCLYSKVCVIQTKDNGYAILGTKGRPDYPSYYNVNLLKTDSKGNEEWIRSYNLINDATTYRVGVQCLQQTDDGGYALCGYYDKNNANRDDGWFIKTDENGIMKWNRTFGTSDSIECIRSFNQTSDSGFILTGNTPLDASYAQDVWLIKIDADGHTEWSKTFGQPDSTDAGYSVRVTNDGGYIIVGSSWNSLKTPSYTYLIKTDSDGKLEWEKLFSDGKEVPKEFSQILIFFIILVIAVIIAVVLVLFWKRKRNKSQQE